MKKLIVVLATTLLLLPVAAASEPNAHSVNLSLDRAIEMARANSPRVRQLEFKREAARAGVDQAEGARLPRIDLEAGYSRNADVPELKALIPEQGVVTIFPNLPDKWQTRASLQLPLYTGGRISSSIDAATHGLDAAGSDLFAADHDLVLETKTAFWDLITAREKERVVAAALASYEQHLVDARNRVDLGFAARNELLAVEAERQRANLRVLSAKLAVDLAESNLRRLTGVPAGERIDPDPGSGDVEKPGSELEDLVDRALAERPELRSLRARIEAADAFTRSQGSAKMPQAGLIASYEYASPNQKILPQVDDWKDTWSIGLGVSWNVFDGGRTAAAEAEARAVANALREMLRDAEDHIRLEVTQHVLDLENAIAAESVARAALEAARENERVTRDRYREGVSPSSDLLDAETLTLRAGLDVTAALNTARIARARLERAVGR